MPGTCEDILRLTTCPGCGYDLDGLPRRHACPECGFEYDEKMFMLTLREVHSDRANELFAGIVGIAMLVCVALALIQSNAPGSVFGNMTGGILILIMLGGLFIGVLVRAIHRRVRMSRIGSLLFCEHGLAEHRLGGFTRMVDYARLSGVEMEPMGGDRYRIYLLARKRLTPWPLTWLSGEFLGTVDEAAALQVVIERRIQDAKE